MCVTGPWACGCLVSGSITPWGGVEPESSWSLSVDSSARRDYVPKQFAGLWLAKTQDTASKILRKPERMGYIGMGNELCPMFAKMIKMLCVLPIKLLIFRKPSNITRPLGGMTTRPYS